VIHLDASWLLAAKTDALQVLARWIHVRNGESAAIDTMFGDNGKMISVVRDVDPQFPASMLAFEFRRLTARNKQIFFHKTADHCRDKSPELL